MKSRLLPAAGAVALAALLFFGILTNWVAQRWALSLYQAAAMGLCVAWALRMVAGPLSVVWSGALLLLAAIPVWGLLQLVTGWTFYPWATCNAVLVWVSNFAIFLMALQLCAHPELRRRFRDWLLYFGFGLSVLSTVQMFTSGGKVFWLYPTGYSDFVLGPFVSRNQYAAFIEMVLPLALYQGVRDPRRLRYWVMASIMVASVVAAASRAGTVLVTAEVVVLVMVAAGRGLCPLRTASFALGRCAALSAIFIVVVGWDSIWLRFQDADPYAARREMLLSSALMLSERPAMGFGLGTWATAYPAYALYDDGRFVNQAHNDWAQWAVEGGLPLLAVLALLAGMLARAAWRSLWGLGLVAVLLHCLVDYPMQQRPALAGWFFALSGALVAVRAGETPSEPPERVQ